MCKKRERGSYVQHIPYDHMVPAVSGEHLLLIPKNAKLSNATPTYIHMKYVNINPNTLPMLPPIYEICEI